MSPATIAAYRSDWARWERWCARRGTADHVEPERVAAYLNDHVRVTTPGGGQRYSPATLTRWVSSLNQLNGSGGPKLAKHPAIKAVLNRSRKSRPAGPRQTWSLPDEQLATLTESISAAATTWASRMIARRDVAVLLISSTLDIRATDLARLRLHDLTVHRGVGVACRIPSPTRGNKSNSHSRLLLIGERRSTCTACAVLAWLHVVDAWERGGRAAVMQLLRDPDQPDHHLCHDGWLPSASNQLVFRSIHRSGVLRTSLPSAAVSAMILRRTCVSVEPMEAGSDDDADTTAAAVSNRHPTVRTDGRSRDSGSRAGDGVRAPTPSGDAARRVSGTDGRASPTYCREWARFVDWCHASGLQALPASTVDVLAYLNAEQPTGGTAARWIAGIRAAHHESELPDPCRGPVTAWVRKRRNPGTTLVDEREPIHNAVQALPVTGWPTGIFGRRDRLAFLIHRIGGIPIRVIAGLRTDQVRLQPQRLRLTLDDADITIDTGAGDPNLCLACAAVRWRWVLAHGPSYTSRDLAARVSGEIPLAGHVCDVSDDQPVGPPGWPLFPAINRWGHLPVPPSPPSISYRALGTVLRDVTRGTNTHRLVAVRQPERAQPPAETPPAPLVQAGGIGGDKAWHRRGVDARARARLVLDELGDSLTALDAALEKLESQIEHVETLADLT